MRYTELCYRMRCSPVLQNAVTTSGKHPDGCASRVVCCSFSVTYLYVECSVKDVNTVLYGTRKAPCRPFFPPPIGEGGTAIQN